MKRSPEQNAAMHLYFRLLAEALNDAGYDMKTTMEKFKQGIEVPWTEVTVKELLWKPVEKAMFHKAATSDMEVSEVGRVYDVVNLKVSEMTGVSVEFPSKDQVDRLGGKP